VALFYLDASAMVKIVLDEPESDQLRAFLVDADIVSSELVLTEVPRAIHRAVGHDPQLPLETLLDRAGEMLDATALVPVDRALLSAAGAVTGAAMRALDAIHVITAADLGPVLDAFVSYDHRQAAAARLAGLRTVAPGS
jgi:uncharacterized protein